MKRPNEETKSKEVRGLEKTIISIRTQMKLQQAQAQKLAAEVLNAFEGAADEGIYMTMKDEDAAKRAYDLALAVLA